MINKLMSDLRGLASKFNLALINDLNVLEVEPLLFIIYDYLSGSPMFNYFESRLGNRLKRVNDFITNESKKFINKPCGCVAKKLIINFDLIIDKTIKNKLIKINESIINGLTVMVTKPVNYGVLLHESIHVLLEHNGLLFHDWRWDEGLVTFLAMFIEGRESILNDENKAQGIFRDYVNYAKKWMNLLIKKKPAERLEAIKKKLIEQNKE